MKQVLSSNGQAFCADTQLKLRIKGWPALPGLSVNRCVGDFPFWPLFDLAHSHNKPDSCYFGWICSAPRLRRRLKIQLGGRYEGYDGEVEANPVVLHEIAHILTRGHGHDRAWLEKAKELGADWNTLDNRAQVVWTLSKQWLKRQFVAGKL